MDNTSPLKRIHLGAAVYVTRKPASGHRETVSLTIHYGNWHPVNGPASNNQKLEVNREDVGALIAKLIEIKDELDRLKVTTE